MCSSEQDHHGTIFQEPYFQNTLTFFQLTAYSLLNLPYLLFPFFLLDPQLPDNKPAQRLIILIYRHIRHIIFYFSQSPPSAWSFFDFSHFLFRFGFLHWQKWQFWQNFCHFCHFCHINFLFDHLDQLDQVPPVGQLCHVIFLSIRHYSYMGPRRVLTKCARWGERRHKSPVHLAEWYGPLRAYCRRDR